MMRERKQPSYSEAIDLVARTWNDDYKFKTVTEFVKGANNYIDQLNKRHNEYRIIKFTSTSAKYLIGVKSGIKIDDPYWKQLECGGFSLSDLLSYEKKFLGTVHELMVKYYVAKNGPIFIDKSRHEIGRMKNTSGSNIDVLDAIEKIFDERITMNNLVYRVGAHHLARRKKFTDNNTFRTSFNVALRDVLVKLGKLQDGSAEQRWTAVKACRSRSYVHYEKMFLMLFNYISAKCSDNRKDYSLMTSVLSSCPDMWLRLYRLLSLRADVSAELFSDKSVAQAIVDKLISTRIGHAAVDAVVNLDATKNVEDLYDEKVRL